jgi:hypothetical protein
MNAGRGVFRLPSGASVVFVCVAAALLALSAPALAIKRATESVNCGGGDAQSASYRAHDTIAQCPIGPVGEGGGMRIYDGFWLTLPNINVPVEGAVFAALTDDGAPIIRWTVGSLATIDGFNIYRATAEEGPFQLLNEFPLEPASPGSYTDTAAWPQTTFWYEVRAVHPDGTEEVVTGSATQATTGGRLALRLYPLRPNPVSESTTVCFDVPDHRGSVRLAIYNVRGQQVRTVIDGSLERGRHTRAWDCRDDSGQPLASGVYFARLTAGIWSDDQKVMVLR